MKHLKTIAVASGKGGVGKSMVAVNLAYGLCALGYRVGILDADIYGPSVPHMVGLSLKPEVVEGKIIPLEKEGVKIISMGSMVPGDQPMIWRGPMVQRAVQQFLKDVAWGELDFLMIDMPPGTGDAHLAISQTIPLTGAIVVSTPQDLARIDARKAIRLFQTLGVPLLGFVENMRLYHCPQCGHASALFDQGGGEHDAAMAKIPFLGAIPIDIELRQQADCGVPVAAMSSSSPYKKVFIDMAKRIVENL